MQTKLTNKKELWNRVKMPDNNIFRETMKYFSAEFPYSGPSVWFEKGFVETDLV